MTVSLVVDLYSHFCRPSSPFKPFSQIPDHAELKLLMMIKENLQEELSSSLSTRRDYAPLKLLAFLVIQIFLAETITMAPLYFIQVPNYIANTLLDGTLMILLIMPGLYLFQLKPLLWKSRLNIQNIPNVALLIGTGACSP